jgi:hypothetical protein
LRLRFGKGCLEQHTYLLTLNRLPIASLQLCSLLLHISAISATLLLISAILRLTCSCTSLGLCYCACVRQHIGRSVLPSVAAVM